MRERDSFSGRIEPSFEPAPGQGGRSDARDFEREPEAPLSPKRDPLPNWLVAALAAVIVGYLMHLGGPAQAPTRVTPTFKSPAEIYRLCVAERPRPREVLRSWVEAGVVRHIRTTEPGSVRVEVDEGPWARTVNDAKISIAMSAWCESAASDGRGFAIVRGYHDGKVKASVTDGSYSAD